MVGSGMWIAIGWQIKNEVKESVLPALALSSLNSLAISSNFAPFLSFSSASSFLECFSHCPIVSLLSHPHSLLCSWDDKRRKIAA